MLKLLLIATLLSVAFTTVARAQTAELYVQTGHSGPVNSVAFSKDGKLLASGSDDSSIKIWLVETRQEIRTLSGHRFGVSAVAFNPAGDILASASHDKTIKLWNIETGVVLRTLTNHAESVTAVGFSNDGKILVSASDDFTVKMWNSETGTEIRTLKGHSNKVRAAVFSPDGRFIATGGWDETIRLWNAADGNFVRNIGKDLGYIDAIAFSADGKLITAKGKFWDTETGNEVEFLDGYGNSSALAFSADGNFFAVGGKKDEILLWKAKKGELPTALTGKSLFSFSGLIESLAFHPNGKLVATGGKDKTVRFWDLSKVREAKSFSGHIKQIHSVAFSPDGKVFVTAGEDNKVKVLNVGDGNERFSLDAGRIAVYAVAFSPDGKMLVSGGDAVIWWDTETGREIRRLPDFEGLVTSLVFTHDGKQLIGGSSDNSILIWNADTGAQLRRLAGHTERIRFVAISPDDKTLASGSDDGTVKVWNLESGKERYTKKSSKAGTSRAFGESVAFSPDGSILAIGGSDGIRLYESSSGKELRKFDLSSAFGEIAFNPDGTILAAGSGSDLEIWNVATGEQLRRLTGHKDNINAVRFSPDNQFILTGSRDNHAKLWPVSNDVTLRITAQSRNAQSVEFNRDFTKIALFGAGYNAEIAVWDFRKGVRLPDLDGSGFQVGAVAFHPEKPWVASSDWNNNLTIFDLNTSQQIRIKTDKAVKIGVSHSLRFSNDGTTLLLKYFDNDGWKYVLWNHQTGKLEEQIPTPQLDAAITADYPPESISFRAKTLGFYKLDNSKLTLFDPTTKKELCNLITLENNDWLVTSPDGLFDGTPAAWKQSIWRLDGKTSQFAPVEAFFKEFYRPQLLQDLISGNAVEPPTTDLSKVDVRQPSVKILRIDGNSTDSAGGNSSGNREVKVEVEILDNISRGRSANLPNTSGAFDLRLFRNGSLVKLWEKNVFELTDKDGCRQFSATDTTPKKAICETTVQIAADKNDFSAYAFNHQNVKSVDATAVVTGAPSLNRKGKLQILSVGINSYRNKNYDLKFAVPDAVDFAAELRKQQIALRNFDAPEIVQLTDAEATKETILYALERFAKGDDAPKPKNFNAETVKKIAAITKTQPEDVLVFYFAGHGTAVKDRFYLIPHDGFPVDEANAKSRLESLQKQSVSDLELEAVLRELDAGQILFVIDACNSGQALEAEEKRRGPMNSRGLAQLAFEKGMYILTAAQSFQAALEVSRTRDGKAIEHGLLTYSLLNGLTNPKADADSDRSITEREWFSFAASEVPRMQLEEMQKRNAELKRGGSNAGQRSDVVFVDGDDVNAPPEKRNLQTPRVFYRRESIARPFIVAKP